MTKEKKNLSEDASLVRLVLLLEVENRPCLVIPKNKIGMTSYYHAFNQLCFYFIHLQGSEEKELKILTIMFASFGIFVSLNAFTSPTSIETLRSHIGSP